PPTLTLFPYTTLFRSLNFSMSGIPYWSADIGGFFGGDVHDRKYEELFTRWHQFAAFTPQFRVHGTGPGKEIWNFDGDVQPHLIRSEEHTSELQSPDHL